MVSAQAVIFLLTIFSRSLARQIRREIGLYEVKSCLGFPVLWIMIILAAFQCLGTWPTLSDAWNRWRMSSLMLGGLLAIILLEIPSLPGADFLLQLLIAESNSGWSMTIDVASFGCWNVGRLEVWSSGNIKSYIRIC